jgi:twitching motility protein PilU
LGTQRDIAPYLAAMVETDASDLFLSVGAPPSLKIGGRLMPLDAPPFEPGEVKDLAYSVMNESQLRQFEEHLECTLSISKKDVGRFRINVYLQRGEVTMVIRYIKSKIPSFAELTLPEGLKKLVMLKRGLVLMVGSAGSGKSTTLAAMLDHRNHTEPGHVVTIEDPIEFLHLHDRCIIDQREVGLDTKSYDNALENALREAPDIIMIGEIRTREAMQQAIHYAETGHLCLATLHANNCNQAIERIINFFPEDGRRLILMDLSLNLRAIVSQRLVPGLRKKLVPAIEVMLLSPFIGELIQKGRIDEIKQAIANSNNIGMQTFDQSLFKLYTAGEISLDAALDHADSRTDLALRIRLAEGVDPRSTSGLEIKR